MRQGNQIDLRTQSGARSVVVTPGNSVQYTIQAQQSRIGASGGGRGLYNCVRGITLQFQINVTTVAAGNISFENFPMVIQSIQLNSPMHGTLIDPQVVNGMIAKWINEFFGLGYRHSGINRQQIPVGSATVVRFFELYIPFAKWWNVEPDHFDFWLGWLNDAILEIVISQSATPWGAGITLNNVTVEAALDMVVYPELFIPPFLATRRYQQSAGASSSGPNLVNVGSAGALQGVEDASRLVTMLFLNRALGWQGSGLSDDITSVTMGWRDQVQSNLPSHFYQRFLNSSHRLHKLGTGAALANLDDAVIYIAGQSPAGADRLNTAAWWFPLVWPEMEGCISQFQKVKGNYPIDMIFLNPQSDIFNVITHELKQFSIEKCSEMIAAAGINPGTVQMVPKLAKKNFKKIDATKLWGLPRSVVSK